MRGTGSTPPLTCHFVQILLKTKSSLTCVFVQQCPCCAQQAHHTCHCRARSASCKRIACNFPHLYLVQHSQESARTWRSFSSAAHVWGSRQHHAPLPRHQVPSALRASYTSMASSRRGPQYRPASAAFIACIPSSDKIGDR